MYIYVRGMVVSLVIVILAKIDFLMLLYLCLSLPFFFYLIQN